MTARSLDPANVAITPTRTLLRLYAATLTELLRRRVIRTRNAPAGDLAEELVSRAYRGELAPASEKSWDVRAADGRLLQVKCRVVSDALRSGQLGLSPFRSFGFDAVVIVLLDEETYDVVQAVELPVAIAKEQARHVPWVNGQRLSATPALLGRPDAIDVTRRLQAALESLDDVINEGVTLMTEPDITLVPSDNRVTRRERRRQSAYREQVLGLPPGGRGDRGLGNYLPADDRRNNFLSEEAARYAVERADVVKGEGGQLERTRLFTNMLSSMPLAFNVFGHLRAHPQAAVEILSALTGRELAALDTVTIGRRTIEGIEGEWAPERRDHLNDGTAFDAVVAATLADGRRLLIAVEVKYIDSFSRDPEDAEKDRKYRDFCRDFGMAESAFEALKGHSTRQLLRNVLLAESVRRGGRSGVPLFDEALTIVFARDDDEAAKSAVVAVDRCRAAMPTGVMFIGHRDFAAAASQVDGLADWAIGFRRRYVAGEDEA